MTVYVQITIAVTDNLQRVEGTQIRMAHGHPQRMLEMAAEPVNIPTGFGCLLREGTWGVLLTKWWDGVKTNLRPKYQPTASAKTRGYPMVPVFEDAEPEPQPIGKHRKRMDTVVGAKPRRSRVTRD